MDFWTAGSQKGHFLVIFGHFWPFWTGGLEVLKGSWRGPGPELGVRWELRKRGLGRSRTGFGGSERVKMAILVIFRPFEEVKNVSKSAIFEH